MTTLHIHAITLIDSSAGLLPERAWRAVTADT